MTTLQHKALLPRTLSLLPMLASVVLASASMGTAQANMTSATPTCGRHVNSFQDNPADPAVQARRAEQIRLNDLPNFDLARMSPSNPMYAGLVATAMFQQGIPNAAARASKVVTDHLVHPNGSFVPGVGTKDLFGMFAWLSLYYQYDCHLSETARQAIRFHVRHANLNGGNYYSTDNLKVTLAISQWMATTLGLPSKTPAGTNGMGMINAQIREAIMAGPGDWASRPYGEKTMLWLLPIIYFHQDPNVVRNARTAYESILARYGSVWDGAHLMTYSPRDYGGMVTRGSQGVKTMLWMYFGGRTTPRGLRNNGDGSELAAVVFPYNPAPEMTRSVSAALGGKARITRMANDTGDNSWSTLQYAYMGDRFGMFSLVGNLKRMTSFAENVAPGVRWSGGDGGSFTFGVPSKATRSPGAHVSTYMNIDPGSQQFMQQDNTMVWMAYNRLGGDKGARGEDYALGRYTTASMRVDQRCARTLCNGAYRLFLGATDQPFIGIVSRQPFTVTQDRVGQTVTGRFTFPLDAARKGVAAIEAFGPNDFSGAHFDEKFEKFVALMNRSTLAEGTRRLSSGFPDVPTAQYQDTRGRLFNMVYRGHWEGNPDIHLGRTVNGEEISPSWPALDSSFAYQASRSCPLFVRDATVHGAGWQRIGAASATVHASCNPPAPSIEPLQVRSRNNPGFCLDSGTADPDNAISGVHIWQCQNAPQQNWRFEEYAGMPVAKVGNGHMCLQTNNAQIEHGTPLHTWPCSQASQTHGGRFRLNSLHQIESVDKPGMCVDVPGWQMFNGNKLHMFSCHGGANQSWFIQSSTPVTLRSYMSGGACMNANTSNPDHEFATISVWQCVGNVPQQRWTLGTQDGQPVVRVGNSGNWCLQSSYSRLESGTQLHTWPCATSAHIPGGRFVLNASNQLESADRPGMCVDISGWNLNNGTPLQLWNCHSGANQKWMPQR